MHVPEFARLSDAVTLVLGLNPGEMTLDGTNCYLVGTGRSRILIDTGQGVDRFLPHLRDCLTRTGVSEISLILITHRHFDHTLGIPQVLEAVNSTNVPIYKHIPTGEDMPDFYSCKNISDGDRFSVPGATLRAVLSPGHTTDHCCFVLEEEKSLFTGDCVLGAGTAVFENLKVYLSSLSLLRKLDIQRCYPGHGPVLEDGKTVIREYIEHRIAREAQIIQVLQSDLKHWWTALDIVKVIYKQYPEKLWPAAEKGVLLHLGKLEEDGKVQHDGAHWRISGASL